MKFQTRKENLEKAMMRIDTIVPTREMQTLLSNVLVSAGDGQVNITASDMESTVKVSIPADGVSPGNLILRAKKFAEIAKQIKTDEILFSATPLENVEGDTGFEIKLSGTGASAARYRMTGNDTEHFPVLGAIAIDKTSAMSSAVFSEMIQKTFYSISQEDNRYIYNGLCLLPSGDKLTMIGTDGRRLAAITRPINHPLKFQDIGSDVVIHAKAIRELQKLLEISDEVYMGIEQRDIFFKIGNAELSSRLLEGKFPDYKKVIPGNPGIQFELSRETLIDAFMQMRVMTEAPSHQVRVSLENNQLHIMASMADVGEADIAIAVPYTGDRLEIGFNVMYLLDILKALTSPRVRLCFIDSNKPLVIQDTEDPDFLALVMPMKI